MENGLKIKFFNVGVNFICFSSRVTALAENLHFKRQLSITAFKVSFLEYTYKYSIQERDNNFHYLTHRLTVTLTFWSEYRHVSNQKMSIIVEISQTGYYQDNITKNCPTVQKLQRNLSVNFHVANHTLSFHNRK